MPAVSRSDIEKNPVQIVFLAANGLWYAHENMVGKNIALNNYVGV